MSLEAIHDALAGETPAHLSDEDDADRPEGALLVSWVAVLEWVTPEDERFMQRVTAPEQSRTMGTGLLWEGLHL
jgi:hypothetical protein